MLRFYGVLLLCGLLLQGCSVGMAVSGSEEPDLSTLRVGATRGEVELHLGTPIMKSTTEDGLSRDVYEYEFGNEPSAWRAVGHGAMDILTIGLWEFVGTPIEAVQGEKYHTIVTYDGDDKVKHIKTQKKTSENPLSEIQSER